MADDRADLNDLKERFLQGYFSFTHSLIHTTTSVMYYLTPYRVYYSSAIFLPAEGDLYEDGLALKNGFFRSRRFLVQSEGSLDLFAEDHQVDSGGEEGGEGGGGDDGSSLMEAKRRKDRLEREEFIRKCRVRLCPM